MTVYPVNIVLKQRSRTNVLKKLLMLSLNSKDAKSGVYLSGVIGILILSNQFVNARVLVKVK